MCCILPHYEKYVTVYLLHIFIRIYLPLFLVSDALPRQKVRRLLCSRPQGVKMSDPSYCPQDAYCSVWLARQLTFSELSPCKRIQR